MDGHHTSPYGQERPTAPDLGNDLESAVPIISNSTGYSSFIPPVSLRRVNDRAVIENPLTAIEGKQLEQDVRRFQQTCLPEVELEGIMRAARVAKDIRYYDQVARSDGADNTAVQLTNDEKEALKAEKDSLLSQRKMFIVILTVSLAAFLQGFVQSSFNGASLFAGEFGLDDLSTQRNNGTNSDLARPSADDWKLGAANASPFFFAGLVGCWLALPVNDLVGRRGAMALAACLIFVSSICAVWCDTWWTLFLVRSFNGIGMGIKAVSTPILASETAVGYWRGSSILAWQLWVSFGIMMGFVFNLIFFVGNGSNERSKLTLQLILGAPLVPSIFLLCPESPRFFMRRRKFPEAYKAMMRLRQTELQALRDIYLVYVSVRKEGHYGGVEYEQHGDVAPRGFLAHLKLYLFQYRQLFSERRLRNALISSSIVALAQQLCGINVFAFYSGTLFKSASQPESGSQLLPMVYSVGYGAVNFVFGLPAIRTIDTLGRRKWLVLTLPVMCLFMAAAALSSLIHDDRPSLNVGVGVTALFVYLFTAAYAPGMGPIPFTLAAESFPLYHREAGCAFAIAINLSFAGLFSILFPSLNAALRGPGGLLGLFSGLNLVALILVFLLVEETKRRSLEDLDSVFNVRKSKFTRYQVMEYLPWFLKHYLLGSNEEKPSLYLDLIWGTPGRPSSPGAGVELVNSEHWRPVDYNGGGVGDAHRSSAAAPTSSLGGPCSRRITMDSAYSRPDSTHE
ncbi:hypothetical protein F4780DRAFT_90202 [Xylariomycetidae sp. FL0641]|nr:hypothetical protein F4780DRAFT_90202 [Xylariomycetidae sp. FL0641]